MTPPSSCSRRAFAVESALVGRGRYADAVARLDAWIAANPKDKEMGWALNNRCWARGLWNHDLAAAEQDCDAALRLRPDDPAILDSRGLVELRQGSYQAALADYSAALRRQPKQAWSLLCRGLAERALGETARSRADVAAATLIAPGLMGRAKALDLAP